MGGVEEDCVAVARGSHGEAEVAICRPLTSMATADAATDEEQQETAPVAVEKTRPASPQRELEAQADAPAELCAADVRPQQLKEEQETAVNLDSSNLDVTGDAATANDKKSPKLETTTGATSPTDNPAAPPPAPAPSLEEVYMQIMKQKEEGKKASAAAQGNGLSLQPLIAPASQPENLGAQPSRNLSLGLGGLLRNSTLEKLLQTRTSLNGDHGADGSHLMRSSTMENILRTVSGPREFDDLMFDWSSLPQDKFIEGLQNDIRDIEAQPPDVKAMRRTFTLERILSGAEGDLQALLKAEAGLEPGPSGQGLQRLGSGVQLPGSALQRTGNGLQDRQSNGLQRTGSGLQGVSAVSGQLDPSATHLSVSRLLQRQSSLDEGGHPSKRSRLNPMAQESVTHTAPQHHSMHLADASAQHVSGRASSAPGASMPLPAGGLDAKLAQNVQREMERLEQDNAVLQQQLDVLLTAIDSIQGENTAMKGMLLQLCAKYGISADMQKLNATIAAQKPSQVTDDMAARYAAGVLMQQRGSVTGAIQQLVGVAAQRCKHGIVGVSAGPANVGLQQRHAAAVFPQAPGLPNQMHMQQHPQQQQMPMHSLTLQRQLQAQEQHLQLQHQLQQQAQQQHHQQQLNQLRQAHQLAQHQQLQQQLSMQQSVAGGLIGGPGGAVYSVQLGSGLHGSQHHHQQQGLSLQALPLSELSKGQYASLKDLPARGLQIH
mmetsp:Transcript_9697/g.20673  ORF Transcript_9697/g.20673 Transcript_9697/m.20673 type:complete len:716 (+) Transcript_9697:155-2302(+)|eukprot:CAMPEP_0202908744 /NCGR_PEP_ID=MMETSP1392-20130828/47099_1 /ASSEMBLY_ACC=CAM_ASM_000868 /TAXON_ID=225041 /ORGANISM="Chlamydomonas chlamydogama, Strain SAG 11-48b" /LENGTH=715 /DNA_ID=CAMNT_0049598225 /DNA_START=109 /DNA_END=2256 /DNA_ORIENTATION=+